MQRKKIILIMIFGVLFFCTVAKAQEKCNLSNLSKAKKKQLVFFFQSLKTAINGKDKIALEKLFHFPYNCSFCETKILGKPYLVVTPKLFRKENYKIFFSNYIIEVINKGDILDILMGIDGQKMEDGDCGYNFSFPIVKPSKKGEGVQAFLTIKQEGDKYKIFSVWSVP
jgi:hypothetical protein